MQHVAEMQHVAGMQNVGGINPHDDKEKQSRQQSFYSRVGLVQIVPIPHHFRTTQW